MNDPNTSLARLQRLRRQAEARGDEAEAERLRERERTAAGVLMTAAKHRFEMPSAAPGREE